MFMLAAMKGTKPNRLRMSAVALICATLAAISTASNAEVSTAEPGGLAVRADVSTLCALIGKMQVVALKYDYDPDAEPREIHPYAVGYTRNGNALLFGLQIKGYSKSAQGGTENLPGWRSFRVDKIRTLTALSSTFDPAYPTVSRSRSTSEFACSNETMVPRADQ
jgi:predicted DNA-binding transcriptional regulator YafY